MKILGLLVGLIIGLSTVVLLAGTPVIQQETLVDRTTANLGNAGVYNSPVLLSNGYTRAKGIAFADQNSATNGLKILQSVDADCDTATSPNWDYTSQYSVTASTGLGFSIELVGRCVKVQYTNGATPQTTFRLASWLKAE